MKTTGHPFREWRPDQYKAVQSCVEAIAKGTKYIILEGPTGSGKSSVAVEILRKIGGGKILTSQVLLQNQYKLDYPEFKLLQGSARYSCNSNEPPKVFNNKIAPISSWEWIGNTKNCGEQTKWQHNPTGGFSRCEACPYLLAVDKVSKSKYSILNYHGYYYQNKHRADMFKQSNLVLDEAHNLNNITTGLFTREFKEFGGFSFPILSPTDCYQNRNKGNSIGVINKDWVDQVLLDYLFHINSRIQKYSSKKSTTNKKRLKWLKEKKSEIDYQITYVKQPYFTYSIETRDKTKYLVSKPIDARLLVRKCFYTDNKTIIFMSATIIDKDVFCKEAGVSPDKVFHYRMKDVFNPSQHLVRFIPEPRNMQSRNRDDTLPRISEYIRKILKRHEGQKGIIHSQTYSVSDFLVSNISSPRFTYSRNLGNALSLHRKKAGSVLISPAMKEGVNLPGKESEFQIMVIVPYPVFDIHTFHKMKINGRYYQWATSVGFIQALGRSIRTPEDTCVTYLIDSRFLSHINLMAEKFSGYLRCCLPLSMEKIEL